jgi:non-ribosomal peptide synthase protein (TIGR01720 family)
LRFLGDDLSSTLLQSFPQAEVAFNYLGRLDGVLTETSAFQPAPEPHGPTRSARGKRRHLLEISAWVAGGRLAAGFVYSESVHRAATIERLANGFLEALRALIDRSKLAAGEDLSTADSRRMQVGLRELEQALEEVDFEGVWDSDEHEEG